MADSIKRSPDRLQLVAAEPVFLACLIASGAGLYAANNTGGALLPPAAALPGIKVEKVDYRLPNLSVAVLSGNVLRYADKPQLPHIAPGIGSAGFAETFREEPAGGLAMESATALAKQGAIEPHLISPGYLPRSLPGPQAAPVGSGAQGEAVPAVLQAAGVPAGRLSLARSGEDWAGLVDGRAGMGDAQALPALGQHLDSRVEATSLVPQAALPATGPGKAVQGSAVPQEAVEFVTAEAVPPLATGKSSALEPMQAGQADFTSAAIPAGLVSDYGTDIAQAAINTPQPVPQAANMVTAAPEAGLSAARGRQATLAATPAASLAKPAMGKTKAQAVAPKEMPASLGLSTDPEVRTFRLAPQPKAREARLGAASGKLARSAAAGAAKVQNFVKQAGKQQKKYALAGNAIEFSIPVQVYGVTAGTVPLRIVSDRSISVRLRDLLVLLQNRMDPALYASLSSSSHAEEFVTFESLRTAGIDVRYDAAHDHLQLSSSGN